MKRETWKMWTWCALVLSIATVGANVFMAFYPNQKNTTTILTPDKIDRLCAEKGWFLIPDAQHNLELTKYRAFYLTKEHKERKELMVLFKNCSNISMWKDILFIQDCTYYPTKRENIYNEPCFSRNQWTFQSFYVFGDEIMLEVFKKLCEGE